MCTLFAGTLGFIVYTRSWNPGKVMAFENDHEKSWKTEN